MLSYEIVGYAPKSPRDWMRYPNVGLWENCRRVVDQLVGPGALAQDVGPASDIPSQSPATIGVTVFGPVVLVAWSGFPGAEMNWSALDEHVHSDRFHLMVASTSASAEFRWVAADGQIRRHVAIDSQGVTVNEGEASLYPPRRGRDDGPWNSRPPRKDPLAGKLTGDVDDLADQMAQYWFDFSMFEDNVFPPMCRFTLPDEPGVLGLSQAMSAVQRDRPAFFRLLAESSHGNLADDVARHFKLNWKDAQVILQQPIQRFFR